MKKTILLILLNFFAHSGYSQFDYSQRETINDYYSSTVTHGDMDGNGTIDQVVTQYPSCDYTKFELLWTPNLGDGVFGRKQFVYEFQPGFYDTAQIKTLKTNDLDNDGDQDIILVAAYHKENIPPNFDADYYVIEFFRNNGNGTFQNPVEIFSYDYYLESRSYNDMVVFDIDNDSDLDILISVYNRIYRVNNLGNGNFSVANGYDLTGIEINNLEVADFNNDGFQDLVMNSNYQVGGDYILKLRKNVNGVLEEGNPEYRAIIESRGYMQIMDVDGDGFSDVLIGESINNIRRPFVYLNNGTSDFSNLFGLRTDLSYTNAIPDIESKYFVHDLDGDGDEDILCTSYDNYFPEATRKLINNGNLSFTQSPLIEDFTQSLSGSGSSNNAFYDFNNDGFVDIFHNGNGTNKLWLKNEGNSIFSIGNIINPNGGSNIENTNFSKSNFQDVDDDGDKDIIVYSRGLLFYNENEGDGNFSATPLISRKYFSYKHKVEDFNNDGVLDVAHVEESDLKVTFNYANGTDSTIDLRENIDDIITFDYENDGDIDIAIINTNYVWINDGNGVFEEHALNNQSSVIFSDSETLDVNNDDYVDFVSVPIDDLYVNLSTGPYQYDSFLLFENPEPLPVSIKFIDYNRDGFKDVIYSNYNGSNDASDIYINYNLGGTDFSSPELLTSFPSLYEDNIYFEDLNQDSYIDILITSGSYVNYESAKYILQEETGGFSVPETIFQINETCPLEIEPIPVFEDLNNDRIKELVLVNFNGMFLLQNDFDIDPLTLDYDRDGVFNIDEDLNNNGDQEDDDTDGDGIPNYLDTDDDGDTVQTIDETTGIGAGVAPTYIYIDTDSDGIENYLDNDDDGDGTLTIDEDYNNNGTPIDDDTNANGIPDFLDDEVFLSVNSFGFEDLSVYPNPTSESFTVQSLHLVSETTITLYDIQGKLLSSEKMLPQNGTLTIEVSSLENGVYFVKISSEGNSAIKKLIKN